MKYLIPNTPIPQARPRLSRYHTYDPQHALKLKVRECLQLQQLNTPPYEDVALCLNVTFYMPLPKNKKLREKYLKQGYHIFRCDLDNLLKFLCDCANGILYKDDCLIVSILAQKVYAEVARTEFILIPLPSPPMAMSGLHGEHNGKNC